MLFIRLLDEQKVRELFSWDENIFIVALLPVGYPAEMPPTRKRLSIEQIII